jgi:hypothetical protein
MAAHRLTKSQRAKGWRKALRSKRTPHWLKPSIRDNLKKLERQIHR